MPDTPSPPKPRKKESWLGVVLTAALCGIFLWWWFLPPPVTADTERDPLYWVGLARKELGGTQPSLEMRFDIIMIAEGLRQRGEGDAASKLEADWLPAAWQSPTDPTADQAPTPDLAPPADFAPVIARLNEAIAAFDALEFERAQTVLREAAQTASALPDPTRTHALWLVAARQARNGLASDAVLTREKLAAPSPGDGFPDWLVAELFDGDIVAPVLAAQASRAAETAVVTALAARWRSLMRERLIHRDHPLLTRHGPATDASTPLDDDAPSLWASVEANQLGAAARLAGKNTAAKLAIARLLVWLAAPAP